MPDHDHGYKLLFSHPEMVGDLLRGFVKEPWVAEIDLDTLERVSGSFVTDDLRERHDDIIWKVKWRGKWVYVYLLLEFQSTVDPFMALRMLVYVVLLYQEIIRAGGVTVNEGLPPVIPIVLYNGERRWTAPLEMMDLIADAGLGLERYRPQLRYLLLEESRYTDEELGPLQNLAAAVFRVENSRSIESMTEAINSLVTWLGAPEQDSLARSLAQWLADVVLPTRLPGTALPPLTHLIEVKVMLEEHTRDWTTQWRAEGMREGMREGEAAVLAALLAQRFGPLDEASRHRIAEADADTLLKWAGRLLSSEHLEDVFR